MLPFSVSGSQRDGHSAAGLALGMVLAICSAASHAYAEETRLQFAQTYVATPVACVSDSPPRQPDPLLLQVEELLTALGWTLGTPDGLNDAQTTATVRIWKQQNGFGERRMTCHELVTQLRTELAGGTRGEAGQDEEEPPRAGWAAPSHVVVSNRVQRRNGDTISVSWRDNSSAEDGFRIDVSTDRLVWDVAAIVWNRNSMERETGGERRRVLRNQPTSGPLCYRVYAIRRNGAGSEIGSRSSAVDCVP